MFGHCVPIYYCSIAFIVTSMVAVKRTSIEAGLDDNIIEAIVYQLSPRLRFSLELLFFASPC